MTVNLRTLLSHPATVWALPLFWVIPPLVARCVTGSWQSAGTVGDAFGIANSLFSGIALLGVVANMQSSRLEAEERERRYSAEQAALREQTIQLAVATRLESTRALLATHRAALQDLNPAIRIVPSSPILLGQLRESIKRDLSAKIIQEQPANEMLEHVDEIEHLQSEVHTMRLLLERIYATTQPSAPTKSDHG